MSRSLALLALTAIAASAGAGILHSGCEVDYPPFCFMDSSGAAAGFSVELLDAALAAMGREVSYDLGPWSEVRGWLETGEVDCLPLVGRTPEREDLFDFTFPYMTLHGAVVVRSDREGILSVSDLDGLTVGVMAGDNAEEFLLRGDYGATLVSTPTFQDALLLLEDGSVDAVVVQRLVGLRLVSEMDLVDVRVLDWPLTDFRQDFCFAVREGDAETLALLNEGLAIVVADGTYAYLHAKWFAFMEIPSHRSILVAGDRNFPPFEYLDDEGVPAGLNVELIRLTAAEVGLDVEVVLDDWADVRAAFTAGEVDVLCGMFYSPDRDLEFDFTQPHTVVNYVPVVSSGQPPVSVSGLEGMSVAVQSMDIAQDHLVSSGFSGELLAFPSQEEALEAVVSGEADCALVARLSAAYYEDLRGWELICGDVPLISPRYCFAVRSGEMALLSELSEGLRVVVESGGYRRAFEKWMGGLEEHLPLSFGQLFRRSLVVLVPLLFLLVWVFFWIRLLRRQVRLRTTELRRSRTLLDDAQSIASLGGWQYDTVGETVNWTDEVFRIHGMEPSGNVQEAERMIASSLDCYQGADRDRVEQAFRACASNGEPYELEARFMAVDGVEKWIRTAGRPVFQEGSIRRVTGYIQDITPVKEARDRIAHLNRVLRAIRDINQLIVRETEPEALLEQAAAILVNHRSYGSALLVALDRSGSVDISRSVSMEGTPEDTHRFLAAGRLPACFPPSSGDCPLEEQGEACGDCSLRTSTTMGRALCSPLDCGELRLGYLSVALPPGTLLDEEEKALLSETAGDIAYALANLRAREDRLHAEADRESLHRQLLQSQKMEAVGQLAGGIAHDFNNMLQVIIGHAQLLEVSCTGEDAAAVTGVMEGAQRAAELTRQLLLFSRRQVMFPQSLDFNELVENMLRMVRRIIGEQIRLEWFPGASVGSVMADPGMMEQVVMNLCVNARDAMPDGGVLTIETMNVLVDSAYCSTHAWARPGRFILLAVTDTGQGMDRQTLDRIFEPFFTTKEAGKGTGIGLATVYGIVKQHEGMINAYSEPGKGSLFKVYLPVTAMKANEVVADLRGKAVGGTETVLVAEDDPLVRELAREMLERMGYTVLTASDGHEAVSLFRADPGRVDLLMLDVIMPGFNGHEVMEKVRRIRPEVPVLFTSGYSENAVHTNFVLHEGLVLLQKPYASDELLRTLRRLLDG